MKPLLYILLAVATIGASAVVTRHLVTEPRESDASRLAAHDIDSLAREGARRAVDEYHETRFALEDEPARRRLIELDARLDEVRREQSELLQRLDRLESSPIEATGDWSIPEEERLRELVSAAILAQRAKEEEAMRDRDRERRDEQRRVQRSRWLGDLTRALRLDEKQQEVIGGFYDECATALRRARPRARPGSRPTTDPAETQATVRRLLSELEEDLLDELTKEQAALYRTFKRENPRFMMALTGGEDRGPRRGGRRRRD